MGACGSKKKTAASRRNDKLNQSFGVHSYRSEAVESAFWNSERSFAIKNDVVLKPHLANAGEKSSSAVVNSNPVKVDHATREGVPALLKVLNDTEFCKGFGLYLQYHYSKKTCRTKARLYLNLLQFWLDVKDYATIAPGPLRRLRAQDIINTFLDSSSKKSLSFCTSEYHEFSNAVENDCELSGDAFQALQDQAQSLLENPYQAFVDSPGRHGMSQFLQRRKPNKFRPITVDSKSTGFVAQETKLRSLIKTSSACREFLDFLAKRDAVDLLLFVIDVLDFHEACVFHQQDDTTSDIVEPYTAPKASTRKDQYLHKTVHKLYRKFLRLEGISKLNISAETLEEIQRRLQDTATITKDIFDAALREVFEILFTLHLGDFLDSSAYQALHEKEAELALRRASQQEFRESIASNPGCERAKVITLAPSLITLLKNNNIYHFREYLRIEGKESWLIFWTEIEEFKRLPYTQANYIRLRANKIFNKYIRRGALMEIDLSYAIRRQIMDQMNQPNEYVFDVAQNEIFCLLEVEYKRNFMMDTLFVSMMNEQQSKKSGRSKSISQMTAEAIERIPSFIDLDEILSNPKWVQVFREFLITENCVSALSFWQEIEHLKGLPNSDYLVNLSKKVYHRFISENARETIILAPETIEDIEDRMDYPSATTFLNAQEEIYAYMNKKLFRKFRTTESFLKLLEEKQDDPRAPSKISTKVHRNSTVEIDESTFEGFLGDLGRRREFVAYCEKLHCQENIYCWIDCQDFRYIPSDDFLRVTAKKIYNKYIGEKAKAQVNLPSHVVRRIQAKIGNPSRSLYVEAQKEIEFLLEKDALLKFKAEHAESKRNVLKKGATIGMIHSLHPRSLMQK